MACLAVLIPCLHLFVYFRILLEGLPYFAVFFHLRLSLAFITCLVVMIFISDCGCVVDVVIHFLKCFLNEDCISRACLLIFVLGVYVLPLLLRPAW